MQWLWDYRDREREARAFDKIINRWKPVFISWWHTGVLQISTDNIFTITTSPAAMGTSSSRRTAIAVHQMCRRGTWRCQYCKNDLMTWDEMWNPLWCKISKVWCTSPHTLLQRASGTSINLRDRHFIWQEALATTHLIKRGLNVCVGLSLSLSCGLLHSQMLSWIRPKVSPETPKLKSALSTKWSCVACSEYTLTTTLRLPWCVYQPQQANEMTHPSKKKTAEYLS